MEQPKPRMSSRGFRSSILLAVATVVTLGAAPALACGGLVGENGTIQLVRTTTLAAYSDGIERYVTAFEFTGSGEEVGSIIPLPDVPTKVERGGEWTLQRLVLEVAPPAADTALRLGAASSEGAEVLLEVEIDALDITVLRGGGDEVGAWAAEHGFFLTPDAPEILDFYAQRSPVFMAARFNAERAADLEQEAGDSTPIMATIPTDDPWVPIRILGLGADPDSRIEADVFLLTADEPDLLAGGTGMTLERSEAASAFLLDDLRSDVGMEWLPQDMWLTYMNVDAPAGELDYDLAISANPGVAADLADTGVPGPEAIQVNEAERALWPAVAGVAAGIVTLAVGLSRMRPGRRVNPSGRWS
ncbi:MAG: DUF2330 domain-containing protein [Actinomycetota bacterium]